MDKKTHKKIESLLKSPIENNQELGSLLGELYGWSKDKIESFISSPWEIDFKSMCEILDKHPVVVLSESKAKEIMERTKQRITREALTH